jgi:hypothetical protein
MEDIRLARVSECEPYVDEHLRNGVGVQIAFFWGGGAFYFKPTELYH